MIKKLLKKLWVKVILFFLIIPLLVGVSLFLYIGHISNEEYAKASKKETYDAIIVPGCPFENGQWSLIMKSRVHWSKYLYDQGITKNIIYSGSAVYSPYIESEIMKQYALELGIPEEHVFSERNAEHSTENLYYSMLIAKENEFHKVALATDPFQSYFLMSFAEKEEMDIDFIPIQYKILKMKNLPDPIINPSIAFVEDFESLPSRQSYLERWKGTLGWYIKRN